MMEFFLSALTIKYMSELTLEIDKKANETIRELMNHYGIHSKAELFSRAIKALLVAACIDKSGGTLLARKGNKETQLLL